MTGPNRERSSLTTSDRLGPNRDYEVVAGRWGSRANRGSNGEIISSAAIVKTSTTMARVRPLWKSPPAIASKNTVPKTAMPTDVASCCAR